MDMINPRGGGSACRAFPNWWKPPAVRKVAAMAAEAAEASAFCPNDPVASAWQACLAVTPCVGSKDKGLVEILEELARLEW